MSVVYFIKPIGMDGPIKIGHSQRPVERLEGLAAWSPWPLEIICAVPGKYPDESYLHSCFADSHSHREWFFSSPKLRAAIAEIKTAGSLASVMARLEPVGTIKSARTSPAARLRLSYSHRIRHCLHRLRRQTETACNYYSEPTEVRGILNRWRIAHKSDPSFLPCSEEIAILDRFLAEPLTMAKEHTIIYPKIRPTTPEAA